MGNNITLLRTTENASKIQRLLERRRQILAEEAIAHLRLTKKEFGFAIRRLEETTRSVVFDGHQLTLTPIHQDSSPCRHCQSTEIRLGDVSALTGDRVRLCRSCGAAHPPAKPVAVKGA